MNICKYRPALGPCAAAQLGRQRSNTLMNVRSLRSRTKELVYPASATCLANATKPISDKAEVTTFGSSLNRLPIPRLRCRSRSPQLRLNCSIQRDVSNLGDNVTQDVVIVGAGMSGLSCAKSLDNSDESIRISILEATDGVGGRVRSDVTSDGFVLDRGFQIFLQGYEELKEILDYDKLALCDFYAGAAVLFQGQYHKVADPLRHPVDGLLSLVNPIGSVVDKVLVGILRLASFLTSTDVILTKEESTIMEKLVSYGFSNRMIDSFFRPFLGGIFFDTDLRTSSRLLEFIFKVLASGSNSLPRHGMSSVPKQLVNAMSNQVEIYLNAKVENVKVAHSVTSRSPQQEENQSVGDDNEDRLSSFPVVITLENGNTIRAKKCIIATEGGYQCEKILGKDAVQSSPSHPGQAVGTICLYFSLSEQFLPSTDPILYLNGEGSGIINNMCFPSTVTESYAPTGQHLASVSLVGNYTEFSDDELVRKVQEELSLQWFPASIVSEWKFIRLYRIPYAQPSQTVPTLMKRPVTLMKDRLYVCGDHRDSATLEGACLSGVRAAKEVIAHSI